MNPPLRQQVRSRYDDIQLVGRSKGGVLRESNGTLLRVSFISKAYIGLQKHEGTGGMAPSQWCVHSQSHIRPSKHSLQLFACHFGAKNTNLNNMPSPSFFSHGIDAFHIAYSALKTIFGRWWSERDWFNIQMIRDNHNGEPVTLVSAKGLSHHDEWLLHLQFLEAILSYE
jgi:hypothetical protein